MPAAYAPAVFIPPPPSCCCRRRHLFLTFSTTFVYIAYRLRLSKWPSLPLPGRRLAYDVTPPCLLFSPLADTCYEMVYENEMMK